MKIPILRLIEKWISKKMTIYKLKHKKKICLVGTAEHDNIGDAAIALAMEVFAKTHFCDYELIEIPFLAWQKEKRFLQKILNSNDIIWVAGGGNLGNRYRQEEIVRRDIASSFSKTSTFIFPQSIWFSDDEVGKKEAMTSRLAYEQNKKLVLFVRDKKSFEYAKEFFPNTTSHLFPDIVCSMNYASDNKREGVLFCVRDLTDESGLDKANYEQILKVAKSKNATTTKNIHTSNICKDERKQVVQHELNLFARHKVVVTDRLHGLIFAIITKTPCVVFKSQDHKIEYFVNFLGNCKCFKYLGNSAEQLIVALEELSFQSVVDYPDWDNLYFTDFLKILNKMEI